jgi:hypothetical protein
MNGLSKYSNYAFNVTNKITFLTDYLGITKNLGFVPQKSTELNMNAMCDKCVGTNIITSWNTTTTGTRKTIPVVK